MSSDKINSRFSNKIKIDVDIRREYTIMDIHNLYCLLKTGAFVVSDDLSIVIDIHKKDMNTSDMHLIGVMTKDKNMFVTTNGSPKFSPESRSENNTYYISLNLRRPIDDDDSVKD